MRIFRTPYNYNWHINILLAFLILFVPNTAVATSSPSIVPIVYSASTSEAIIRATAAHYAVSGDVLMKVLKCESNLRSDAVGDSGRSFGVAQIFLPAHPEVTKEQALNAIWAIDWTAKQFSLGNARAWTCYRNLIR